MWPFIKCPVFLSGGTHHSNLAAWYIDSLSDILIWLPECLHTYNVDVAVIFSFSCKLQFHYVSVGYAVVSGYCCLLIFSHISKKKKKAAKTLLHVTENPHLTKKKKHEGFLWSLDQFNQLVKLNKHQSTAVSHVRAAVAAAAAAMTALMMRQAGIWKKRETLLRTRRRKRLLSARGNKNGHGLCSSSFSNTGSTIVGL